MAPRLGGGHRGAGDDDALIDRDPRNIPLPVAGFRVVWRQRRASSLKKWWRRNAMSLVALVGLLAALAGAYLARFPPPTPVYFAGGSVYVGRDALNPGASAPGLYVGSAAFVITPVSAVDTKAAASARVRGEHVLGICLMHRASATEFHEHCTFAVGTGPVRTLTADDDFDKHDRVWHRMYGDGRTATISVPSDGLIVPVPFLVSSS